MPPDYDAFEEIATFREYAIIATAAVSCFVFCGVPWWHSSYDRSDMDGFILTIWIVLPMLCAMFANYYLCQRTLGLKQPLTAMLFLDAGLIPSLILAVMTAVMVRVVKDVLVDSTSHNLWPFELIVASFPAGFGATIGAVIGLVIAWVEHSWRESRSSPLQRPR